MVNYVLADTTEAFEVILLADKAPGSKNFNAAITVDEDAHKALEQLMRAGD